MIELLLGKAGAILAGVVAALGILATMFGFARRGGKIAERNEQREREAEAVKQADEIAANNARISNDEVKRRLKEKWLKL